MISGYRKPELPVGSLLGGWVATWACPEALLSHVLVQRHDDDSIQLKRKLVLTQRPHTRFTSFMTSYDDHAHRFCYDSHRL